jgi:predicted short-subunit dehydrogenase-like oxidoreductase (DUF2520 family)
MHECVSKSFRTESLKKYTRTTINTRWEATRRVMAAKLTRMTHKIAIQLHLVAESCTICSHRSRRTVRKLLDTPSYMGGGIQKFPDRVDKIKCTPATINTRWEATQSVMAVNSLDWLRIAIQLHLIAESCTICSSRSRRSVRKLLDTPSYVAIRNGVQCLSGNPNGREHSEELGIDRRIILIVVR